MFIKEHEIKSVYIRVDPVDFRKGINGLGSEVDHSFGNSIDGKNLFVFTNRKKDRIKALYWDDTGYALWQKVLEESKFRWPKSSDKSLEVTTDQLSWLLSGLSIEEVKPHRKIEQARQFY